jgi:hypothetical protein
MASAPIQRLPIIRKTVSLLDEGDAKLLRDVSNSQRIRELGLITIVREHRHGFIRSRVRLESAQVAFHRLPFAV